MVLIAYLWLKYRFVVGYNLDYNEYFRDMNHIAVINQVSLVSLLVTRHSLEKIGRHNGHNKA